MINNNHPNCETLHELQLVKMPFGKYAGRAIIDLPESYLLWFQQKGLPSGKLGQLMALALEIKSNGLDSFVNQALGR
ncbi:MAG: DUF3820 family protein [Deltaproteobacteria bacterium]|nr:DUF3820 family protein [Deltaproteobacteria bacterium]